MSDFTPQKHQLDAQQMMKKIEKSGKGGILADQMGLGKCLHPDTKVLMWSGGYKLAKNIVEGDLLVGDDSKPRTVLSTCSGNEMMYEIQQNKGENYTVNESHILSLKISDHKSWWWCENKKQYIVNWFDRKKMKYRSKCYGPKYGTKDDAYNAMKHFRESIDDNDVLDIQVNEYLKLNKSSRAVLKGFKVGVDFPDQQIFLDPYLLGAWLGDGNSTGSGFTNVDEEVLQFVEATLDQMGCDMIPNREDSITYRITGTEKYDNPFRAALNFYELINNKHIPLSFLHNSRKVRLWVLAGLIDTDGYKTTDGCCYEIVQKNKRLSEDIAYLARSLGFFVSYKQVKKSCMYKGEKKEGTYHRCVISGDGLDEVPVLLERNKCSERKQKKNVMVTNITVKSVGEGKYCGFTIDGNRRFLLHDFTVTHNTITMTMFMLQNRIPKKRDLVVCPFSILNVWSHWIDIISKNLNISCKVLIYHGPKRNVEDISGYDIIITTYSTIGTGELNRRLWGRVVLDESHNIKNGLQSKAPKSAKAAFVIGKRSVNNWCISGTPFNNRMKDIASQAIFLDIKPYNDPKWWQDAEPKDITYWRNTYVIRRTKENLMEPPTYHDIYNNPKSKENELFTILRNEASDDFKKWKKAKQCGDNLQRIELQGKILGLIQKLRLYSNSYHIDYTADSEEILENNAKVESIINDIDTLVDKDPYGGVVVFSQFTSFLSILENVIEDILPGIDVYKFNGSMSIEDRDITIKNFNESREPRVILISLMAGSVGLSLHHGSATVMLCEPYYNPFIEQQAEERVHRIGQEYSVNVYRYYMNNSIENWITGLKKKKLTLAGDMNFIATEDIPTDFNFDDIELLFREHVGFLGEKEDVKQKQQKKKTKKKVPGVKK